MDILYIMEKAEQAHIELGWSMGGSLELGYNVEEVDDLWLYIDIHHSALSGELSNTLTNIRVGLEKLFGCAAKTVEVFDSPKSSSGYSVAVELNLDYEVEG